MSDFNVIGAGVAGLTVASELLARGASVTIYDPKGAPGDHCCSWWAGGMLAPFCEFESAEEPVLRLGQTAAEWWASRTHVTLDGTLVVASGRDLPDLRRFSKATQGFEPLDAAQVNGLEPDVALTAANGLFFEGEGHLDPRQALSDLWTDVQVKGAEFMTSAAPIGLENRIDCTGFAAKSKLPDLRGVKGEMLILRCPDITLNRPIRLLHPRIPLYIVPRGNGIYMLGATMLETEDRGRITARSMLELLSAAYSLNPAFGEAEILEIGVDVRPAFPDNLPRVQVIDGVTYANGLFRHGYLLSPALAGGVADWVCDGQKTELFYEHHS